MPDFEFFVGGIEDGIIALLEQLYGLRDDNPNGYLKETTRSYGGDLDEKALLSYISESTPQFPLFMVAYEDGADKLGPATSPAQDVPRTWRHDCGFGVIACDNNARGEREQRRGDASVGQPGVINMISNTRDALAGLRFRKEGVLLTLEPLRPAGVEYIARLPQLTAYVAHFDTHFNWTETDRRGATIDVSELIFEVGSTGAATEPGLKPGVTVK